MSWTSDISGAAIAKAGEKANISGALLDKWAEQAQGQICVATLKNYVASYPTISNAATGYLLADIGSSMVAKQIISFDMSGYTSKREAETMLDVQDDVVQKGIGALKELKDKSIET